MGVMVGADHALPLMKETLAHCAQVIASESGVEAEALVAAFRREEDMASVLPLAGIPEALRALKALGGHHYLVTHRDRKALDALRGAGILELFDDAVTSEDGFPRKPEPDSLLHLLRKHSLNPDECVMIGDRPLDTEAGRRAGMLSCLLDPEGRFPEDACELRVGAAGDLAAVLCPEPRAP